MDVTENSDFPKMVYETIIQGFRAEWKALHGKCVELAEVFEAGEGVAAWHPLVEEFLDIVRRQEVERPEWDCSHAWTDAVRENVDGGEVCLNCGRIRRKNDT